MADVKTNGKKHKAQKHFNGDEEYENFDVEYQPYGQDTTDSLPKNLSYTSFDTFIIVISIILYLADIISDIFVAYIHYTNKAWWWFSLTIIFIGLPTLTMTAFSLRWYLLDEEENAVPPVSQSKWTMRIIFLVLQLGPVLRYIDSIFYGIKYSKCKEDSQEKREMYLRHYVYEEADATLLRLFECFMESAPQLVLQIFILTQIKPENPLLGSSILPYSVQTSFQVLSIFVSLSSMAWCLAFYQRALRHTQDNKKNLSLPGMLMQFVWRFLTIGSRVLALALFASAFQHYVAVVCLLRYLLMTTWIVSMKTNFYDNKCEEFFYNCVLGVMFIFCYFNPKDTPTRRRFTIFYLITFIENTFLMILWAWESSSKGLWYYVPALLVQPLLFIMGILFMVSYYLYFHPTGSIKVQANWKKPKIRCCDHDGPPCQEPGALPPLPPPPAPTKPQSMTTTL